MRIIVNESQDDACGIANHFESNWNEDTLHPKAKIPYIINKDSNHNEIIVVDDYNEILLVFPDSEALRLDKLQEAIINL